MENETIRKDFANDPDTKALRVQEVVRQVQHELCQLLQQRAHVVQRICTIKKTILGLASLLEDDVLNNELRELLHGSGDIRKPGLTHACRLVLMKAGRALGAREVRDQIQETAPTILIEHKDSMASVTTILTRLVTYGEAQVTVAANGKRIWQWAAETGAESALSKPGLKTSYNADIEHEFLRALDRWPPFFGPFTDKHTKWYVFMRHRESTAKCGD